jgi:hypothetical protein
MSSNPLIGAKSIIEEQKIVGAPGCGKLLDRWDAPFRRFQQAREGSLDVIDKMRFRGDVF